MVGTIGTVVSIVGRTNDNWAVNLIGVLGNAALQQIPNIEKVDELITQFVSDYNNQWEKQQQGEEE